MDYIAQPKDYWIAQNAINITLNALGNPNRIQCSVASGAAILCYIEGVEGLGYDNGHRFKTWPLSISPTYFNSNTEKYVYVAIPRSASVGTQAVVVFPSEKLDIYGVNENDAQVGSTDYYYIWLQSIISSSGPYGNTNRTLSNPINFGKKGTDEDLYDDTTSDWYQYSKVSEVVTFLKNITMKAGTTFHNLILGYKELTGVATATTDEEFVDSETLVVTPSYLYGKYLSRHDDDTAEGEIGFLRGLWVGVKGLYEITAEGVAKFKSLFVTDITANRMQVDDMQSSNYTGDGITDTGWRLTSNSNGRSKLTIDELYVRMKAVFESLEIKKELVSGGNEVQSCAASVISKVDYLDANKDILGYDTYKVPFTLRNAIVMLAKGQNPFGSYSRTRKVRLQLTAADRQNVRYVRCYFLAKEGDRKIQNWWRVADPNDNTTGNDMARCQTFNLASDSISERDTYFGTNTQKIGNIFWWRKLAGVSTTPVEIDGKMYHYFDVFCNPTAEAATPYTYAGAMQGSDIPAPGDEVSQWGNDNNIDRMNLIVHEVNGQDAAIKMYEGINQFSMENGLYGNPLKIRFAPKTGCKVHTTKWEVVTENFIAPIPVECGEWPQGGTTAHYYEIWQHGGSSWLCVASNGGTFKVIEAFSTYSVGDTITQTVYDTLTVSQQMCCARVSFGTTTDEPSTTSAAWRQYAAKGEKGDNVIRIDIDNEYDSIQYQGDGVTKVSPSGTVQTTAYLFDGITDKSSDATFTISNRSGMSDQQSTISGRVVTVSGLTSDGEVTIRAEYPANSGKYYYAKFTVKKLIGIDKYDLVVTPNAVPVNTSNIVADTAINVQVYRTPANGGTRHLVEFTNKITNNYGLTLSVKDSLNNNLTETTGTGTVTTRTFNLTGTMATNADNVMIVLTKDSKTQDAETVPVTHVHNGIDGSGSNAVKIDLDNEMDSIPCDSDGKVMSQIVLEVNARIYDGASPVGSGVAVSYVGAIAGVSAVTSISNGVVNIKWTIPATGSGTPLSVDKYTSQIELTWNNNSYYATFTANVVKSGEPGVSPTIYNLKPSQTQIAVGRTDAGGYSPNSVTITCGYTKSVGNTITEVENATSPIDHHGLLDGYLIVFRRRLRLTQAYESRYYIYDSNSSVELASFNVSRYDQIEFYIIPYAAPAFDRMTYLAYYNSISTVIDKETVPVVADGVNGASGNNGKDAAYISVKGACHVADSAAVLNPNNGTITIFDGENTVTLDQTDMAIDSLTGNRRGLALVIVSRADLSVVEMTGVNQFYDTYKGAEYATTLANRLNTISNQYFVCLFSYNAIGWSTALKNALKMFGGSEIKNDTTGRYPFAFIGYRGLQEGCAAQIEGDLESTITADAMVYVADGNMTISKNGEDAVNIIATPASLIVNQDLQNINNLSNLSERILFTVTKGSRELSVTSVDNIVVEQDSSRPKISVSGSNSNYATLTAILTNAAGKYYDQAYFTCRVGYADGVSIKYITNVKVKIYANLLGTWKEQVIGDVKTEVAEGKFYFKDEDGNVVAHETIGDFIKSSTENTSRLQDTVTGGIVNLLLGSENYPADNHLVHKSSALDGMVECDGANDHPHIYTPVALTAGEKYVLQVKSNGTLSPCHDGTGASDVQGKYTVWLRINATGYNGEVFTSENLSGTLADGTKYWVFECQQTGEYWFRTNTYSDGTTEVTVDFWEIMLQKGTIPSGWALPPRGTSSLIRQTATEIEAKVENTGVDITNGLIRLIANKTLFLTESNVPMIAVQMCDSDGNVWDGNPSTIANYPLPSIVFYNGEIGNGGQVQWVLNYLGFNRATNTGERYRFEAITDICCFEAPTGDKVTHQGLTSSGVVNFRTIAEMVFYADSLIRELVYVFYSGFFINDQGRTVYQPTYGIDYQCYGENLEVPRYWLTQQVDNMFVPHNTGNATAVGYYFRLSNTDYDSDPLILPYPADEDFVYPENNSREYEIETPNNNPLTPVDNGQTDSLNQQPEPLPPLPADEKIARVYDLICFMPTNSASSLEDNPDNPKGVMIVYKDAFVGFYISHAHVNSQGKVVFSVTGTTGGVMEDIRAYASDETSVKPWSNTITISNMLPSE